VTARSGTVQPLLGFLFLGGVGAAVGLWAGTQEALVEAPAPYRVPRTFGGTALRMAMVHDVLHERYPRHGQAYYQARERQVRADLAGVHLDGRPSLAQLALLDDLSAALDHQHRAEEAVTVQRQKLAALERLHPEALADVPRPFFDLTACRGEAGAEEAMRQIAAADPDEARLSAYRTHANLGTHLIHAALPAALKGEAEAKAQLREGLEHVRLAVGIRPGAHFGREEWQVACVEALLARLEGHTSPPVDLFGTRLDEEPFPAHEMRFYRPGRYISGWNAARSELEAWIAGDDPEAKETALSKAAYQRTKILKVGFAGMYPNDGDREAWKRAWPPAARYPEGVPFDEPVLAILGMWMLGGGPNPHFALALGSLMEQVGQRHLAWSAYQRALDLGGDAFPWAGRCRERQAVLEKQLLIDGGPKRAELLKRYRKELDEGLAYQAAYQDYEADLLTGEDALRVDQPGFYAGFFAEHGEIATPPGSADEIRVRTTKSLGGPRPPVLWEVVLLGAGLGGFLGSLIGPRRRR
jgi:hypothetical protein